MLYIAFAAKSGGYSPPVPLAPLPITYGSHVSCLFLPSPHARLLFSFEYLVYHQTQIYHICPIRQLLITRTHLKIIRGIVNMGIKDYSQLIDIVNFCGKQHNISSSKKHMALIYCKWSNDLGFITRSSNNFCLP